MYYLNRQYYSIICLFYRDTSENPKHFLRLIEFLVMKISKNNNQKMILCCDCIDRVLSAGSFHDGPFCHHCKSFTKI